MTYMLVSDAELFVDMYGLVQIIRCRRRIKTILPSLLEVLHQVIISRYSLEINYIISIS